MHDTLDKRRLVEAFAALGERLHSSTQVLIGGAGALVLRGELTRATTDCDVLRSQPDMGQLQNDIRAVADAPPGSVIAVGTEIHLVKRLDDETPDKTVVCLDPLICPCSTMSRIDPPHLAWVLEGLVDGEVRNRIQVDGEVAEGARVALERMLAIT